MEEDIYEGRHLDHNAFHTGQPDALSMGVGLQTEESEIAHLISVIRFIILETEI